MTMTMAMTMTSAGAVAWGQHILAGAHIDSAAIDARLLVCHAAGLTREDLIRAPERPLGKDEERRYRQLVSRRMAREPVAYLIGIREFWGLEFICRPGVLIPRPDSETLVGHALGQIADTRQALRILDLGTGTGALLLALLHELPNARGVGTDISPGAIDLAMTNAGRLGLSGRADFHVTDWAAGLAGRFDLVISNPPYIAETEIAGLARDVRDHEPRAALAGGPDGLDAYREISRLAGELVAPGGKVMVEIGQGQGAAVRELFGRAGLAFLNGAADLGGIERVQCFEKV